MDTDYILVEGDLDRIKALVEAAERRFEVTLTKGPSISLTMVRAQDSVEEQEFYLGEALITEVGVAIDGKKGLGLCLGDEPVRAYCMAVVEALLLMESDFCSEIYEFLRQEERVIRQREQEEQSQILRTEVDFKLMEQS